MSSGILPVRSIININKTPKVEDMLNFFNMMEIYGSQSDYIDNEHFEDINFDALVHARTETFNILSRININLETIILSLDQMGAGSHELRKPLSELKIFLGRLLSYWQGKFKKKDEVPLFGLNEPSISQVGHLISLTCGHNGKPERHEVSKLASHLDLAGFV